MLEQLGRVAKKARLDAGLKQIEIATAAGVTDPVISHLERGVRYPRELDRVIAAYESECGLRPGELWRQAVAGL